MKNRFPLLLLFLFASTQAFCAVYYVSPSGNNTSGLSTQTAFNTIQQAANIAVGGDTVFVMNGTYTNLVYASSVAVISTKASASKWLVFKNYPGHTPIIQLSANWSAIALAGAAYVIVDGFTVIGNNDNITLSYAQSQQTNLGNPSTSGSGISIQNSFSDNTNHSQHIIIRNCSVTKCGGGGIASVNSDYITVFNNTVSNCGWYSPYDASAISLYQNWNSDSVITTKNYVTNNTCYGNRDYIPSFFVDSVTDGNGIIVDDSRNLQGNSTLGPYKSTTYIANNVVFNNGGHGIHAFKSDNVIVINNTVYLNCLSPTIPGPELSAIYSGNISFINNISQSSPGLPPIGQYVSTNITADHNIWASNSTLANPFGTNTKVGNPSFVLASINPLTANFQLQPGSIAIDAGTTTNAPTTDHTGATRLPVDSIDIGAYQILATVVPPVDTAKKDSPVVTPPVVVIPPVDSTPVVITPPVVTPPADSTPVVVTPPVVVPPIDSTPVVITPPMVTPPADTTPVVVAPPVVVPPVDSTPVVITPPVVTPPADTTPVVVAPPVVTPPADSTPVVIIPPVVTPPVVTPPVVTPPVVMPPADSTPIVVSPPESEPNNSQQPLIGLIQWKVSSVENYNDLVWTYGPNSELDSFVVQRNNNGTSFTDLSVIKKNADSSVSFDFTDSFPESGTNFYRLKIFNADGEIVYSPVISIYNASAFQATVFPNPTQGQVVVTTALKTGNENSIKVFDGNGKMLYSNVITGTSTTLNTANWPAGWYVIALGEKHIQSLKIIKQ